MYKKTETQKIGQFINKIPSCLLFLFVYFIFFFYFRFVRKLFGIKRNKNQNIWDYLPLTLLNPHTFLTKQGLFYLLLCKQDVRKYVCVLFVWTRILCIREFDSFYGFSSSHCEFCFICCLLRTQKVKFVCYF